MAAGLRSLGPRAHPVTLLELDGPADVSYIGLQTHVQDVLNLVQTPCGHRQCRV